MSTAQSLVDDAVTYEAGDESHERRNASAIEAAAEARRIEPSGDEALKTYRERGRDREQTAETGLLRGTGSIGPGRLR